MRRKQEDEVQEGAAWMTTYSDMVTLLFTFFVLMFAISSIDNEKFAMFLGAIQPGGLTAEKIEAIEMVYRPGEKNEGDTGLPSTQNPTEDQPNTENADLQELFSNLKDSIIDNKWEDIIIVEGPGDGNSILFTLPGDAWFASGSADITEDTYKVALMIAHVLKENFDPENPFEVAVSGHTDNRPQNSAQYPNNWWLSSGRALKFEEILIIESGILPKYFSVQAHGDTMPVDPDADNNLEENRRKNRRVEVLITQSKSAADPTEESEDTEDSEKTAGTEDTENPEDSKDTEKTADTTDPEDPTNSEEPNDDKLDPPA